MQIEATQDWAAREFADVRLGDKRLSDRAVSVAAAMAGDPLASVPKQNKQWKQTKGAYRLFDHERATFEAMSGAHWENTRSQCAHCCCCCDGGVVLLIQDTTWLDYSDHAATSGLGWFGRSTRNTPVAAAGCFCTACWRSSRAATGKAAGDRFGACQAVGADGRTDRAAG